MIMEWLESITEEISKNFLYGAFKGAGGLEVIHRIMEQTIEPVSHGYVVVPEPESLEPESPEPKFSEPNSPETTDNSKPLTDTVPDSLTGNKAETVNDSSIDIAANSANAILANSTLQNSEVPIETDYGANLIDLQ